MKKFYKRGKIFYIFYEFFLIIMGVLAIIHNVLIKEWGYVFLVFFTMVIMSVGCFGILLYYRNIVTEVLFDGDNTIIKTNSKTFILPSKNFVEVNDSNGYARIFISYMDGEMKKRFMFQKRYSPFKTYTLNIDEMRKHMTSAIFKTS